MELDSRGNNNKCSGNQARTLYTPRDLGPILARDTN